MAQDSQQNNTKFTFVDLAIVIIVLSILTLMAILYTLPCGTLSPSG